MTRTQSSSVNTEGIWASKSLDDTVFFQCKIIKKWIREVRGEELHGTIDGWSSILCLLSVVSLPGRNEWLRIHCSEIKKEKERKDSSCQMFYRAWERRKNLFFHFILPTVFPILLLLLTKSKLLTFLHLSFSAPMTSVAFLLMFHSQKLLKSALMLCMMASLLRLLFLVELLWSWCKRLLPP